MGLSLSQTSFNGNYIKFKAVEDIYYEVEVLDYNKTHGSVEVVNYNPINVERFNEQSRKSEVHFIKFKPLNWLCIKGLLSMHTKSKLLKYEIITDDIILKPGLEKSK